MIQPGENPNITSCAPPPPSIGEDNEKKWQALTPNLFPVHVILVSALHESVTVYGKPRRVLARCGSHLRPDSVKWERCQLLWERFLGAPTISEAGLDLQACPSSRQAAEFSFPSSGKPCFRAPLRRIVHLGRAVSLTEGQACNNRSYLQSPLLGAGGREGA